MSNYVHGNWKIKKNLIHLNNQNIIIIIEMSVEELRKKNDKLLVVGNELKTQFIGLDDTIDQIISAVRVWYLMPELMTRPIIINLWGLTGTGKTSLVRKFVQLIQM